MCASPSTSPWDRRRIEDLFARQRAAQKRVAASGWRERVDKLRRLKKAILDARPELLEALAADLGKGEIESEVTELYALLIEFNYAIRHLRKWMRPSRVGSSLLLMGSRNEIRSEPRGLVLMITPWNYPLYLSIAPLIASIAAGNCSILKPSEKSPATSRFMANAIATVFDEDEVAVVPGDADVSEALLAQPFDHFFYTGGARIGRKVMEAAAVHLSSVTLELGGKSPVVVDETADLRRTAERLVWGKFLNGGQTCVAPDYALVHESVAGDLATRMSRVLDQFYGQGDDAKRATGDYCRMVDGVSVTRLGELIQEAVQRGATVVSGGGTSVPDRYVAPTILMGADPRSGIMEEEIFGPVFPLVTFSALDEAIEFIRSRPSPLAMYVFSRNRSVVERLLGETQAGGVGVNTVVLHLANPALPFGGVGQSGYGSYHGEFGFRAFSHQKPVMVQTRLSLLSLFFPPFTGRARRVASLVRKYLSWPR